ncbi:MAG: hypothetical protein Q4C14_00880 [Bacillota bacterium]|nr:hypothetical protein [Bacillota bacterium]
MFNISAEAKTAIYILEAAGYKAYLAGGCVRDLIMGSEPHDWDIATSAEPFTTREIFEKAGYRTVCTGISHGTVTAVINKVNLEITTFRQETGYSDHRRPDSVMFVKSPEEDVKRRDFTINGILYNPSEGILDYNGGIEDIKNGIIRCIGDPDKRFSEDALRIMRAMRFASALGFTIEKETSDSMIRNRNLLNEISMERKAAELTKLLLGKDVKFILYEYSSVLTSVIPEIRHMIGFEQNNPHHCYDVWIHTIEAVAAVPADPVLRLTMLLHDIGKPDSCTMDSYGINHFFRHPGRSASMARNILSYLRYPGDVIDKVCTLITYHDYRFYPDRKNVKKLLNRIGEECFRLLLEVRRADISAQNPDYSKEKFELIEETRRVLEEVIEENQCFSLKDLKISGKDLLESGFSQGKHLGYVLDILLNMVINEEIPNERDILLENAQKIKKRAD